MVYKLLFSTLLFCTFSFASFDKDNIKNFKANFIQKVTNESSKSVIYKGIVYIKNSGKVLWKYQEPVVKNIFLLDNFIIIDEPELEQAIYTKLDKSINIVKLLDEAVLVENNVYKSKLYEIEYLITIADENIKSISYKDELENKVSIIFDNVEQNSQINDEVFNFIPPKDYDIIEK